MNIISELISDLDFILKFRKEPMRQLRELDRAAPKVGDLAPDFTLSDVSGTQSITLSDFRGEKPVALAFGSYT